MTLEIASNAHPVVSAFDQITAEEQRFWEPPGKPSGGREEGRGQGIDGKTVYQGDEAGKFDSVILSVKAGHVTANHVRELRGAN
jgi:hypothetical protein